MSEILLTVDLRRSKGRFGTDWESGRDQILELAHSVPDARIEVVNYGSDCNARVAAEFFGGTRVPEKDFRGGPYYAYFFGLHAAKHDFILHTDSDMFFGGGSQTWAAEAIEYLTSHPEVLITSPLPGPPSADGRMKHIKSSPVENSMHTHRMDSMSKRIFLIDRARFRTKIGALRVAPPPSLRNRLKALLERNPCADLPEHLFTDAMRAHGLVRHDFLGNGPGMWSLHPPYRCADFYTKLPSLSPGSNLGTCLKPSGETMT